MGRRQGLTATHQTPATSSTHQRSLPGKRTSELPCPVLLSTPIPVGPALGSEGDRVKEWKNRLMERRRDGARKEEGKVKMERDREKERKVTETGTQKQRVGERDRNS